MRLLAGHLVEPDAAAGEPRAPRRPHRSHGHRRLHRHLHLRRGYGQDGPIKSGDCAVALHDPHRRDPRGGRDSGGDPALRHDLAVHRLQGYGEEARPCPEARGCGDTGLRLRDLQRQDRDPHRGQDDHGEDVGRGGAVQRGRQGLRSHCGPHHEGRRRRRCVRGPRGEDDAAVGDLVLQHDARHSHRRGDGRASVRAPGQLVGGADRRSCEEGGLLGGGRGGLPSRARGAVLLLQEDDAHGERRLGAHPVVRRRHGARRGQQVLGRVQGRPELHHRLLHRDLDP
mmetsp:Transcript_14924/g.34297  ORF Transcript_14924/g.34297 Transcript_14924/m.34297 type:complete len:284 (+) Transcript_14924:849-1700(+)